MAAPGDDALELRDLQKIPFLAGLEPSEIAALCVAANVRNVAADELIFKMGEPGQELCVILDGEVAIELPAPGVEPTHLATLRQGTVFGEINFLLASERTADARALRDTRLMVLERDALDALEGVGKQAVSSLMETLARVLALRLSNMDRELVAFKEKLLEAHPDATALTQSLVDRRDHLMFEWAF